MTRFSDGEVRGRQMSVLGPCLRSTVRSMRETGATAGAIAKTTTCSVEGCGKFVDTRGLCSMHYRRLLRGGTTELRRQPIDKCSIDGCSNSHEARGLCQSHYKRWQRHQDPMVRLNKGCAVPHCLSRSAGFGRYCHEHAEIRLMGVRAQQDATANV